MKITGIKDIRGIEIDNPIVVRDGSIVAFDGSVIAEGVGSVVAVLDGGMVAMVNENGNKCLMPEDEVAFDAHLDAEEGEREDDMLSLACEGGIARKFSLIERQMREVGADEVWRAWFVDAEKSLPSESGGAGKTRFCLVKMFGTKKLR